MHLTRKQVRTAALAATILGGVLVLIAGFMIWHGNSSDSAGPGRAPAASSELQTDTKDLKNLRPTQRPDGNGSLPGFETSTGTDNPFANSAGDTSMHKVTITVTSDGAVYFGYIYRNGGKGLKVADRTFTTSARMHGPLPMARVAVRVIGNATYATCAVFIDGVKIESYTAKGSGHIGVCTG